MLTKVGQQVGVMRHRLLRQEVTPLKPLYILTFIAGQGTKFGKNWTHLGLQRLKFWPFILTKKWCQLNLEILLRKGIKMFWPVRRQRPGQDSAQSDKEAAQHLWIMGRRVRCERCNVVQVLRRHPVDEGYKLTGHNLLKSRYACSAGRVQVGRPPIPEVHRYERYPEHIVQIDLDPVLSPETVPVVKVKLSPGVLLCSPLDSVLLPRSDLLHSPLNIGPLPQHVLSIQGPNVIKIEIHRKARGSTVEKQVERRASLEDQSGTEEGMPIDLVEKAFETQDLL